MPTFVKFKNNVQSKETLVSLDPYKEDNGQMTNDIYFCYFNLRSQNFATSYWCEYITLLSRLLEDSPSTIPQKWQYHRLSKAEGRSLRVPPQTRT